MSTTTTTIEKKFPAGKYYIGDPGYAIDDIVNDTWTEFVELSYKYNNNGGPAYFEFHGHNVLIGGTAHGDGVYMDELGHSFAVDSGLIGILPIELVDNTSLYSNERLKRHYLIKEFDEPFYGKISSNGIFEFGNIYIETDEGLFDEDYDDDDSSY